MMANSPQSASVECQEGALVYRKGLLGDLLVILETGGRRIQIGSVPVWEDQERVMGYIDKLAGTRNRTSDPLNA